MGLLLSQLAIVAIGVLLQRRLAPSLDLPGRWWRPALGYVVGSIAIGVEMLVYSALSVGWSAVGLLLPWVGLALWHGWRPPQPVAPEPIASQLAGRKHARDRRREWLKRGLGLLLVVQFAVVLSQALLLRPFTTDGTRNWSFRAKMFALAGGVDHGRMVGDRLYHPPLVSLNQAWCYVWAGTDLPDPLSKLPGPMLLLALLALLDAALVRAGCSPLTARAVTTYVGCAPAYLTTAASLELADVPFAAYLATAAWLLLVDWGVPRRQQLRLAALVLVGVALAKEQGTPLALALIGWSACISLATHQAVGRTVRATSALVATVLVTRLGWSAFLTRDGLSSGGGELYAWPTASLSRIRSSGSMCVAELLNRAHWDWLFYLVAAALVLWLVRSDRRRLAAVAGWVILHPLAIIAGLQLDNDFHHQALEVYAGDALPRLTLHMLPFAAFLLGQTIDRLPPRILR